MSVSSTAHNNVGGQGADSPALFIHLYMFWGSAARATP